MTRDFEFDMASSAVAYAFDVLARAAKYGHALMPRDHGPIQRRLERRARESMPSIGPTPGLARFARKMREDGQHDSTIARMWGCHTRTMEAALDMFPENEHEPEAERAGPVVEQGDLLAGVDGVGYVGPNNSGQTAGYQPTTDRVTNK